MNINYWDTTKLDMLLRLYVGKTYGESPSQHIDTIRAHKKIEAEYIVRMLALGPSDVVLDLGPGCGFIAKEISPLVDEIHCADISSSFLDFCKIELSGMTNIRYHLMSHANIMTLAAAQVTKVYAAAVFIHFNLYDIYHYLRMIYALLAPGGKVLFNFLDDRTLNITDDVWVRHSARYLEDRTNLFTNVYYNNAAVVINIAKQIGFDASPEHPDNQHCWLILNK
jgi:ubiquinone/menaquinone biosynthesis C-methylase UbiE